MADAMSEMTFKHRLGGSRVNEIAKRLGVYPAKPSAGKVTIVVQGRDGENYDIIEIMTAFLDRMDKAMEEKK